MENNKKSNAYFEAMAESIEKYYETKRTHASKKERILKEHGWGSEEMQQWYDEDKEITFPVPNGAAKACSTWYNWYAGDNGTEEIVVSESCWEKEIHDFIAAFRNAGIRSFVFTDHSTALMYNIHGFVAEGCALDGLCTVEKPAFGGTKQVQGIRFTL